MKFGCRPCHGDLVGVAGSLPGELASRELQEGGLHSVLEWPGRNYP